MTNVNSGILNILKCTNNITEDDLVLENCGDYHDSLVGYSIVLPKQYLSDMKYCLIEIYKIQSDFVTEVFDLGDTEYLVQTCRLPCRDSTYTDIFIEKAGSAEKLIGSGIPNMLSDNDLEDEEDMYKEMYEQLKKESEELINSKTEELDRIREEMRELRKERELYLKSFGTLDTLEDEDLGLLVELLDNLDEKLFKQLVFDLLVSNAGDDSSNIEELKSLSFYVKEISNWLLENNIIG